MTVAQLTKEQLLDLVVQQQERINALEHQVRYLVTRQFGTKSEKLSADQLALFGADAPSEPPADASDADADADAVTISFERKRRGKRKKLDDSLERHRIEYELSEADQACDCGGQLTPVSTKVSEQYEYIPARVIVIQHSEHQYTCACCQQMVLAKKPPQPLPKTNAAAGLLAHLITTKYVDAVPLHRQEKQLARVGITIPRNTLARWVIQLSNLVVPLLNLMEDLIRAGPVIQCDETPHQVLKEAGRKAQQLSYIWVRRGGGARRHVVLFDYSPNRSGDVALRLMADYQGYVQCDGYSAYGVLASHGVTLVGCMAHCRRKFKDALAVSASKEKQQRTKAAIAIGYIKRLYEIEAYCKTLGDEERKAIRQEKAGPVLAEFKQWLDEQQPAVLPKSPLGKAIRYALNQWPKLMRYCEEGYLEIDNNSDERAIRPLAIGRRNYLFADTPEGAQANARFYSLIETCKLHGHEPYAYLKYIFKELPRAESVEQFEALLPWNLEVTSVREIARAV
ncbi:MAG: IS66 family transposase [Parahaliea sp.]